MYVVPEEDYLAHYGRKGMKWYQHIFGDDSDLKKAVERFKKDVQESSKAEKVKTAGALLTSSILGGIGGRKLGGKIGVKGAFNGMKTVTTYIGGVMGYGNSSKGLNTVIKKYIDAPTMGECFKALEIGSSRGLAIGVALPLLGYAGYKGYKYISEVKNPNKRKTSNSKKKVSNSKKKATKSSGSSMDFKKYLNDSWW